ncbi:MAG: hypothetical protein ACYTFK_01125 [Planctomycetota bacterium]|jgi:hypothetical protein
MWSPENIVSFLDVDRSETERSEVPTCLGRIKSGMTRRIAGSN